MSMRFFVPLFLALAPRAFAGEASVVTVLPRDPQVDVILDLGGALPEASKVDVRIEDSFAVVARTGRLVESDIPVATVLLVDTSGSMDASLGSVKDALHAFVAGMAGGDVALLVPFSSDVAGVDGAWIGVADRARLDEQIDALSASGSTHLYDALNRAVDRLVADSAQYPLRTIVVLSDGEDSGSPEGQTLDRARGNAVAKGVRINAVGYTPTQADSTSILSNLAHDTNGRYQFASDADRIRSLFEEVQRSVHELVVITVDAEPIPAGAHEVKVVVPEEGGTSTATFRLDLAQSFTGTDLPQNDPPDRTGLYVGATLSVVALCGLVIGLTVRARRRRESALHEQVSRQVDEAKEEARRIAAATQGTRRTRIRLLTAAGSLDLFAADDFRVRVVGSASGGADIVVDEPSVSATHARIERRAEDPAALYVTDLGSTNGTYHQGLDVRGRGTLRVAGRERLQFGLLATLVDVVEV